MFRNRGELPNIDISTNNNNNEHRGYGVPHYSNYWRGRFIVIKYDKTFVAIELIATLIIILVAVAVYLFAYQVTFNDPIAKIKDTFLTTQLISIAVSFVLVGLVTFFSKSKEALIRNLKIVATISLLIIFVHLGVKLHLDNKYNKEKFEEFYETYEQSNVQTNDNSKKITVGISGVKNLNAKESYVEDSINAYTNFKIKTMLYMVIYILVVVVIFYLAYRLSAMERKKEELQKDDAVLFDEEENIKF